MDTPQKSPGLASIRTFAKDLEMKKQSTPSDAATPAPAPKTLPEATLVEGENNVYQAPTWKKRKAGPVMTETAVKSTPVPEPLKKIPEPTLKPLTSPKTASAPTIIVDNEDAANATIIRDTKHNRFRLFPAIGSSLRQWFSDIKEKYFTKKAPKYTVPETTLRKGVIQKATSKTGKIATFDHSSLQERIRERRDRVAPKTPTTTWTANTEPGYLLLEGPDAISNVQVEPRKSFRVTPPTPKPVEPAPLPKPVPAPVVVTPEPTPIQIPEPEPLPVEPLPEPEPELPVTIQAEPAPVRTTTLANVSLRDWLFSMNTNLMSLGVAGLVLALVLTGAVGFFWFRSQIEIAPVTATPTYPSLLNAPVKIVYAEELTQEALHNLINAKLSESDSTIMQLGVVATKDGTVLLPVPAILEALNFNVSAVFSRSIDTLYFGNLRQSTPFIIFKASDQATARGGMLAWESSLYEDTLPILAHGASARNLPPGTVFTDTVVGEIDTRSLRTKEGEEYLVYTLAKDNVVIITTNTVALQELFTALK